MDEVLENVILPEHNLSIQKLNNIVNLGYESPLLVDNNFLNDLKNNSLESKNTTMNKLYILQGKLDTTVSPIKNQEFFNKYYSNNHEIYYFENADHRFKKPGELEQIIKITLDILK